MDPYNQPLTQKFGSLRAAAQHPPGRARGLHPRRLSQPLAQAAEVTGRAEDKRRNAACLCLFVVCFTLSLSLSLSSAIPQIPICCLIRVLFALNCSFRPITCLNQLESIPAGDILSKKLLQSRDDPFHLLLRAEAHSEPHHVVGILLGPDQDAPLAQRGLQGWLFHGLSFGVPHHPKKNKKIAK